MELPDTIAAWMPAAAAGHLPFAVWRRPHAAEFEAVISCGALERRAVFQDGRRQAAFVLQRFACDAASPCDAIAGDIAFKGNRIRFFDGSAYVEAPASDGQKRLERTVKAEDRGRLLQAPAGFRMPAQMGEADYVRLVARAVDAIRQGRFRKVVTSRAEMRCLDDRYDLLALVRKLAAKLPSAFVCLVYLPGQCAWLVGTPETLLSHDGACVRTVALAGTQWLDEGIALDAIEWPDKIIQEQALVSDYIADAFAQSGLAANMQGPNSVRAANLVHLRSDFEAPVGSGQSALLRDLLERLHPTSAVCGMPKSPARRFLDDHEGYDRDYYTGFLGPAGIDGRTDLFVNLRTAQIIGDKAVLYVGGGIVADSRPDTEWQETVEKTRAVGSVL